MIKSPKLIYEGLTYKIRGAIFKVYNELGFGHRESVYRKALAIEFNKQAIPHKEEPRLEIKYDGLGVYVPDFLIDDKVIIEMKSVEFLPKEAEKQPVYYLKGTSYRLGFLVNFGASKLEIKRKIWG